MKVNCKNCETEFEKEPSQIARTKSNFCSRSCSARFNNKGRQRNPPKPRKCKECNKAYLCSGPHRSRILCADCGGKYKSHSSYFKSLTLKDYWLRDSVKGKHPSWRNTHVRGFNRSWNKGLLKNGCQVCGYSKHVELAHIKPISSFIETATLGEINSASNLLTLCRNHHWEFDHSLIKIEDVPNRFALSS